MARTTRRAGSAARALSMRVATSTTASTPTKPLATAEDKLMVPDDGVECILSCAKRRCRGARNSARWKRCEGGAYARGDKYHRRHAHKATRSC